MPHRRPTSGARQRYRRRRDKAIVDLALAGWSDRQLAYLFELPLGAVESILDGRPAESARPE